VILGGLGFCIASMYNAWSHIVQYICVLCSPLGSAALFETALRVKPERPSREECLSRRQQTLRLVYLFGSLVSSFELWRIRPQGWRDSPRIRSQFVLELALLHQLNMQICLTRLPRGQCTEHPKALALGYLERLWSSCGRWGFLGGVLQDCQPCGIGSSGPYFFNA
jgi:hypothetical protein